MTVDTARPQVDIDVDAAVGAGMQHIVLRAGAWLLAYCVIATIVSAPSMPSSRSVVALVLLAVSFVYVTRHLRGLLSATQTWLLAGILAVVVALPASEAPGCDAAHPESWGADGAMVIVFIMVLLNPAWWAALAAILGFSLGFGLPLLTTDTGLWDCVSTSSAVFVIEAATVLMLFTFRRVVTRLWTTAYVDQRVALDLQTTATERAAREHARQTRLRAAVTSTGPLLTRIASGEADPAAPDVIHEAAMHEATLRSLIMIDPDLDDFGDALAAVLFYAHDRGRYITVRSGEAVVSPGPDQVQALIEVLQGAVRAVPVGSEIPISLFAQPDGGAMTIVATSPEPLMTDALMKRLTAAGLLVSQSSMDEETLVEVQWTAS